MNKTKRLGKSTIRGIGRILCASALLGLVASCAQLLPQAGGNKSAETTGYLSVTIPEAAAWILASRAAESAGSATLASKALAYATSASITITDSAGATVLGPTTVTVSGSSAGSGSASLKVPSGEGYSLHADVYNSAYSATEAAVSGDASGTFSVQEGKTTAVTVTCLPAFPIALSLGSALSHNLTATGEAWYKLTGLVAGSKYHISQSNSNFRLGLFDAQGAYLDNGDYGSSTSFNFTSSAGGDVYIAVVGSDNTASEGGSISVIEAKCAITAFSFDGVSGSQSTIGEGTGSGGSIAVTVPYGTSLTSLVASFTASVGATVTIGTAAQTSGATANDFSSSLTYTVTGIDGSTKTYEVTVTPLLLFNYTSTGSACTITGVNDTWNALADANATKCELSIPSAIDGVPVSSIAETAFTSRRVITSISIPASVTSIGQYSFYGCSGLTSLSFESGIAIESIEASTFTYCTALPSITIPASVTSIGLTAFESCSSLTSIDFESGSALTNIVNNAFINCTALASFSIPSGVTRIGKGAFQNCTALSSLTALASSPPTAGSGFLSGASALSAIHVPSASLESYKAASNWSAFSSIMSGL
jgi:hypothetical protein